MEEHAAAMWEKSDLPAVGPTAEGKEINHSEKVGGLIHELENAHVYIEQLNEQAQQQKAELTAALAEKDRRLAGAEERLARIEALLAERPGAVEWVIRFAYPLASNALARATIARCQAAPRRGRHPAT